MHFMQENMVIKALSGSKCIVIRLGVSPSARFSEQAAAFDVSEGQR